ncbi:unnamed protein product [Schistosoma margrebowiei]|uniref:Uncharacterized protein n=1 Tax=Schistosoma margrebowiei TaxID=48269 RepID=A0A183N9F8_9TREM|nr:unnamed protein product [Schistosoma margrebowiei]
MGKKALCSSVNSNSFLCVNPQLYSKLSSMATRFLKELEKSRGAVTWNQNKDDGASLKESMIFHNYLENDTLANCEGFDLGYKPWCA